MIKGLSRGRGLVRSLVTQSSPISQVLPPLEATDEEGLKSLEDIPSPPGFPILKNIPNFLYNSERAHLYNKELTERYGNIFKFKMPGKGQDTVLVSDPRLFNHVLANDGKYPITSGFDTLANIRLNELKHRYPSTAGLLNHGQPWLEFRQSVQQDMMRPKSALCYINDVNRVMDAIQSQIDSFASSNNNRAFPDILDLTKKFALESIAVIFLGKKLNIVEGEERGLRLLEADHRLMKGFMKTWALPLNISKLTPYYKRMVDAHNDIADIADECVKEYMEHKAEAMENKAETRANSEETVLDKLIKRSGLEFASVMAQDALLAGSDTTGNAASFLLYNIAANPEVQETLYKEIKEVLGDQEELTETSLSKMKYLKACVQESLRLNPVVLLVPRRTNVPLVLDGYKIPAGTNVMLNTYYSARFSDKHFSQPDAFMPERWLRCPERQKVDAYANLPFGHGARSCIGQRFARLELQVLACRLVQRYKMSNPEAASSSPATMETVFKGLGGPSRQLDILFTPRH